VLFSKNLFDYANQCMSMLQNDKKSLRRGHCIYLRISLKQILINTYPVCSGFFFFSQLPITHLITSRYNRKYLYCVFL